MKFLPFRLVPDNTQIDFMRLKNFSLFVSLGIIFVSFIFVFIKGFNFGIDFTGGVVIEARPIKTIDLSSMRHELSELGVGDVTINTFGEENDISIRIGAGKATATEQNKNVDLIKQTIIAKFDPEVNFRKVDFVGPQVGQKLITSSAQAISLAFVMISLYIWSRFEWQFAVGVLITLFHDLLFSIGFMSVSQLEFNLSTIAALLTIIGFSVNDTVIIYDRIRENLRKFHKTGLDELINLSINGTLSRTTMTVMTTLLSNIALIIFGGEALRSFSILIFMGILFGTYSSIYVSAPILKHFGLQNLRDKEKNAK